ncbi:MAG: hypothetical protein OEZ58_19000 [Gammaproteobacteria bacterium]|nr:hypothetical protein [Gammaproteobacteria bacterium]
MRNYLLFFVFMLGAIVTQAEEIILEGPFSGTDLSKLKPENAKIIMEANVDFLLVLEGRKPKYAKTKKDAWLPADGGTTFYVGDHYNLTIVQSMSTFGEIDGYVYGPVIEFDKSFALGNSNSVSNLKFYTSVKLNELQKAR